MRGEKAIGVIIIALIATIARGESLEQAGGKRALVQDGLAWVC